MRNLIRKLQLLTIIKLVRLTGSHPLEKLLRWIDKNDKNKICYFLNKDEIEIYIVDSLWTPINDYLSYFGEEREAFLESKQVVINEYLKSYTITTYSVFDMEYELAQ